MFLNISFHICNLVLRREDQSVKHVYGGSAATTPPWPNHQTQAVLQHRNSCEQTHDRLLVTTNVRSNPSTFTGPTQVHLVLTDATTEPKILWSWKCESAARWVSPVCCLEVISCHMCSSWSSCDEPAVFKQAATRDTHSCFLHLLSSNIHQL